MTPGQTPELPPQVSPELPPQPAHGHWFQRLSALLFMLFCFELGLFLMIYPWTEGWTSNFFASVVPDRYQPYWHDIWINHYVRGAVSGLGVTNLWVAIVELFQVFAHPKDGTEG